MSTNLCEFNGTNYAGNMRKLSLTSFYGGNHRGMILSVQIEVIPTDELPDDRVITIELNKTQAIHLANSILWKFDPESK